MSRRSMNKRPVVLGMAIMVVVSLLATLTAAAFDPNANILDIKGSTTLYPFVKASQTQFPIEYPGTIMNISQGGSGVGQSWILSGQIDIAMSSSKCSDANAGLNGAAPAVFLCNALVETLVGRDALSFVVNNTSCMAAASPRSITRNQLSSIYMGLTTDWNAIFPNCAVGTTIIPRARSTASGTYASVIDLLKARTPPLTVAGEAATIAAQPAPYNVRLEGNPDMESAIGSDPTNRMLGYVGLAFTDPSLVALQIEGVAPSEQSVSDGTYKMGRNLYLYTAPTSYNPKQRVQDYLAWIVGFRGQAIVENYGYAKVGVGAPNWDVDVSRKATVGDLTSIGAKWQQVGPDSGNPNDPKVRGWIREDVNFDAKVTVGDLTTVGGHWQQTW